MVSSVITLLPVFYALSNREAEFLGLCWIWWSIIGFIIFFVVNFTIIVRLIFMIKHYHSDDYQREKRRAELELEKLELEKDQRDNPQFF